MGDLSVIELVYWSATIIGGTLFILRTVLMFVGGDGDASGHDLADADLDDFNGHPHGDFSFNLLSLQGLTAFFTMFGLVGLTLFHAGVHVVLTMFGGAAAGLATVFVISLIFAQAWRLQSEGNLDIRNAVGERGSVYLRIPAGGTGQVQVTVQGSLRVLDAVAETDEVLPTGTHVEVTAVKDNRTLIVRGQTK